MLYVVNILSSLIINWIRSPVGSSVGMLYNEITASSLIKVDMQGHVVEGGTTNFGVNVAGFMLHSAIHEFRPDLKCVLHMHTPNIVAVSAGAHRPSVLCRDATSCFSFLF